MKKLMGMVSLCLVGVVALAFAVEGAVIDPSVILQSDLAPFFVVGILLQGLIPVLMAAFKKYIPDWDKKAWAPPLIGAFTMLITAMATGKVTDTKSAIAYFLVGYATGGAASSTRDIVVGK